MQLGGAGVVIVVVRAGGADGVGETVDQDQQSVTGGEEDQAGVHPISAASSGRSPKSGDTQQHARAEGDNDARPAAQAGEPKPERRSGQSNCSCENRCSDSGSGRQHTTVTGCL